MPRPVRGRAAGAARGCARGGRASRLRAPGGLRRCGPRSGPGGVERAVRALRRGQAGGAEGRARPSWRCGPGLPASL